MDILIYVEIISIQIWYIVVGNKNNNFLKTLLLVPHDLLLKNALHRRKCIMRTNGESPGEK